MSIDQRDLLRPTWAHRVDATHLRPTPTANVHDFSMVAFITDGRVIVDQETTITATEGDVYLLPAGHPHAIQRADSPRAWAVGFAPACFDAAELAPLLDPFDQAASGAAPVIHIPGERQQQLADLCAELQRESLNPSGLSASNLIQKSLLVLILAELSRAPRSKVPSELSVGFVGDVLRYIERFCLGPITVEEVAAAVRRAPSHVSTTVKRATGKSIKQWIITCRLSHARQWLLNTDESIEVIADRVGYADPTHFIRLFRREHGMTPAAWRAAERAKLGR